MLDYTVIACVEMLGISSANIIYLTAGDYLNVQAKAKEEFTFNYNIEPRVEKVDPIKESDVLIIAIIPGFIRIPFFNGEKQIRPDAGELVFNTRCITARYLAKNKSHMVI